MPIYLWLEEFVNCVIKEWNMKNTTISTVLFFMKEEGDTIVSLTKTLSRYAR